MFQMDFAVFFVVVVPNIRQCLGFAVFGCKVAFLFGIYGVHVVDWLYGGVPSLVTHYNTTAQNRDKGQN